MIDKCIKIIYYESLSTEKDCKELKRKYYDYLKTCCTLMSLDVDFINTYSRIRDDSGKITVKW